MPTTPTMAGAKTSATAYRAARGSAPYPSPAVPNLGVTSSMATYAPSAKSDPCARLMTSMTPTISMKPSARSPKRTPSATPLITWGRRSMAPIVLVTSGLVHRCRLERLEVALALGLLVEDLVRRRVAQDLEEIVRVLRLE